MLYACALSPDGKITALGGYSRDIYIFDTETGMMMQRIDVADDAIYDLDFSMDGLYLAAALGRKAGVRIYQFSKSTFRFDTLKRLNGYEAGCYNICFDGSGRLATVCWDGFLRLYDKNFNEINKVNPKGGKKPWSVSFKPDGSKIAVGYSDSRMLDVCDGYTLDRLFRPDTNGNRK